MNVPLSRPSLGPGFWADAYDILVVIEDVSERQTALYDLLCSGADQMDADSRWQASYLAESLGIAPAGALPLVVPSTYFWGDGVHAPADMAVWDEESAADLRTERADFLAKWFGIVAATLLFAFLGRLAIWGIFHR